MQFLLQQIMKMLHDIREESSSSLTQRVAPFIDIYQHAVHKMAPELPLTEAIDLNISEKQICEDLIVHVAQVDTGYESEYLFKIKHLLTLILSPPQPFVNKAVDISSLVKKFISPENQAPENQQLQQKIIVSILAAQNSQIANMILQDFNKSLDEILAWTEPKTVNANLFSNVALAKFWLNLTNDHKVKSRLQDMNLPIKLYQMIRCLDEKSERIVKEYNEDVLVLLVELILKVSAGHSDLEEKLTKTVLEDLKNLSKKRDLFFINKVLLPLIKNELTIPVCIIDRNFDGEAGYQGPLEAITSSASTTTGEGKAAQYSQFVPSPLMDDTQREAIIEVFKEVSGSKASATLNAQWVNAQTWQSEHELGNFAKLWQTHQNKGPVMALVKMTKANG